MKPQALLTIGLIWFVAAMVLGIYFSQTSFAIGWLVKDPVSNAGSLATIYFLFIFTMILLIGWAVPIGISLYRLIRH